MSHADQSGGAAEIKKRTGGHAQIMAGFAEIPYLEHRGGAAARDEHGCPPVKWIGCSWLYNVRNGGRTWRVFEFCCWQYPDALTRVVITGAAVMTEYFDRVEQANGEPLLVVTTTIEDPTYLTQPYMVATHFQRQRDAAGWTPTPCAVQ